MCGRAPRCWWLSDSIKFTGWVWWDPIAAMLAALNILRVGYKLIRESLGGLLDESDPAMDERSRDLLDREVAKHGLSYHNFRHRALRAHPLGRVSPGFR